MPRGKRQKYLTKAEGQRKHALRRAKSRFGLDLKRDDLDEIANLIRTGKTKCVEKISNSRSLHRLTYQEQEVVVVYDRSRKTIVTFLYPEEEMI